MSEPTVEDLLAAVDLTKERKGPRISGLATVQRWVGEFQVAPGISPASDASGLYYHYKRWCAEKGYVRTSPSWMLFYLRKHVGLLKKRRQFDAQGREHRTYLLARESAAYFRGWAKQNPTPENEILRSTMTTKADRYLENESD